MDFWRGGYYRIAAGNVSSRDANSIFKANETASNQYDKAMHSGLQEDHGGVWPMGSNWRGYGGYVRCVTEQEVFKEVRGLFFPDFLV